MRIGIILCLLPFLFAGCGYHAQGRGDGLPDDVGTVYVEIFANRTLEPFLDITVSKSVIERFIRGRLLQTVERPEQADAVLSGEILTYATTPVGYDRRDEIARYRSSMTVAASLKRADTAEVLWQGRVSWSEEYAASQDKTAQQDNEATAIRIVGERIAEEVYSRIGDNF